MTFTKFCLWCKSFSLWLLLLDYQTGDYLYIWVNIVNVCKLHHGKIQTWKPVFLKTSNTETLQTLLILKLMFLNGGRLKIFFPIILYIYLVAFGRICNYQVYWIADALSMEGFASDQWELLEKLWQVFYSWIEVQITKIENMMYLH